MQNCTGRVIVNIIQSKPVFTEQAMSNTKQTRSKVLCPACRPVLIRKNGQVFIAMGKIRPIE